MKKKANEIYEKFFAQEYDNIWFTSDEHYENIYTDDPDDVCRHIVLSKRRIFKNTKEMVRGLILNFNQMVGENDLTFHLGDFGSIDLLKNSYLNGDHIILPGNYELEGKYFEGAERDTVFEGLSHYAGKPKRYLIRSDPGFMIPIANFPKYFDPNMIEDIDVLYLTHKPEDHASRC